MDYTHKPVLLQEVIDYLKPRPGGIYLDGTLGRGGHTEAILKSIGEQGQVIGIDRDLEAIEQVRQRLSAYHNLSLVHGNFADLAKIFNSLNLQQLDGMIFDLGVSSPQFDNPERGFSYRYNAKLDMRMDRQQSLTAREIVNTYSEKDLSRLIKEYGEERWASRIAKFIVKRRQKKAIETTFDLVEIIKDAIPAGARRQGVHPARRTFQALRIATNDELKQLTQMIQVAVPYLKSGGRLCIISFHSLEDRIVKKTFQELAKDCICPPHFPVCVCNKKAEIKIITRKPVQASQEEIKINPRARSAKLRVAEKF